VIMSIIIPIQGNSVLGRGPLQWTRSTAAGPPPSPPLSSISIVSSAGTSISIPDNQANGAISTLSLSASSGAAPDGSGTWTLQNGGYTRCSLSASTGRTVTTRPLMGSVTSVSVA